MSEISDLLNDIIKNFDERIKEIYNNKLAEHQKNISYNLNDGYTENYGKLELDDIKICDSRLYMGKDTIKNIIEFINKNNKYIIHSYYIATSQFNQSIKLIDNYGTIYELKFYIGGGGFICNHNIGSYELFNEGKYVLPDILINFVKKLNYEHQLQGVDIFDEVIKQIQIVAEDYYKKFTKYASFYQSGKLLEYEKMMEIVKEKDDLIKILETEKNDTLIKLLEIIKRKSNLITLLKEKLSSNEEIYDSEDYNLLFSLISDDNFETCKESLIKLLENINKKDSSIKLLEEELKYCKEDSDCENNSIIDNETIIKEHQLLLEENNLHNYLIKSLESQLKYYQENNNETIIKENELIKEENEKIKKLNDKLLNENNKLKLIIKNYNELLSNNE